ncbi:TLC domain-containing protein [Plasmodiophora brassicae]|uniref:TLC domain-containing protein n=1 Tax=Plasmodiophora brassicae TaxID=37360 RepID=A0A0G4J3J0_PLABS|nr:hypothetical protein PBRA_008778 [Plasmodiophora brassicae]SPR01667.1 unnamed protein product [Plasmodiophora brassicae]
MDAGRLADYAPAIAGSTILFEILSKTSLPAFHASFGAADRPALPKKLSAYLTSTVHALISVAASVALLATPSNIHEDRLFGTDRSTTLLLSFSAGYFLHDLIDSIQRFSGSRSDVLFVVHHVVSLYIYASAALLPVGQYWCCTFLVYEASTPFLNWQGFLRDVRWGSTGLLTVAKIMFAVTFIAVRIVYGTAATFLLWKDLVPIMTAAADGSTLTTTRPVPHVAVFIVYFVLSVLFMMLNAYWGYMIVQKIRRAISKRKSS